MKVCLTCENVLTPVLSFGPMPIANGFLTEDQFADEPFFDLSVGFCEACKMLQLMGLVPPNRMFHENYAFFSSTSIRMARHFQEMAEVVKRKYLGTDPFVVEIGSNDGIMLQHFANSGVRHLGVEPSSNVAQVAQSKGINTICEFFNENLAKQIVSENGQADAFLGANVMCHIPTIHSVVAGVQLLLKPSGVLMFEDPYLGDIIEKTSYDQIYDEHAFYFSITSLDHLFSKHGMEIIDAQPQTTHGGSMRYTVAHKGALTASESVYLLRTKEEHMGLGVVATYEKLRERIERSRDELVALLQRLKAEGKRVTAYGATSKSTTVTNYCGITPRLVEFITDTTPIKQGKYSPGTHIPIKPQEAFSRPYPHYALLFAWNHAEEIKAKEAAFRTAGGQWIVYVPQVETQP